MTIIEKIRLKEEKSEIYWSFEYYPPKTETGMLNLYERLAKMSLYHPLFIDVTWGAGGSTSNLTMELCQTAQNSFNLETCMHLTCTNMPSSEIDKALAFAKSNGIRNILALRGDAPRGVENWVSCENGYSHAVDLIRHIKAKYGDYFCISVAGYPEGHSEAASLEQDIVYLAEKVAAGAEYIITQLFYDTDLYISWVKRVRSAGIKCPILPGIMPLQSYEGFKRMTRLCQTRVPQSVLQTLETIKHDESKVKEYGIDLATSMCRALLDAKVAVGFHFFTLNLDRSVLSIIDNLGWMAAGEPPTDLELGESSLFETGGVQSTQALTN